MSGFDQDIRVIMKRVVGRHQNPCPRADRPLDMFYSEYIDGDDASKLTRVVGRKAGT